ncbi:hypothetical protein DdX_19924 [Ditylenchus destructor]|uniref:Uncharacterized protein n=1 Tax=Ditylenchus destructor TaxID=166010 RepID=A0AAD4QX06_9BILA|nr:hypothetical protein DdX_19924 [Ditylenchus destructor]
MNSPGTENKEEWAKRVLFEVRQKSGMKFITFPKTNVSPIAHKQNCKHNSRVACLREVIAELDQKYSQDEKDAKRLEEWATIAIEEADRRFSVLFPEEREKESLAKKKLLFGKESDQVSETPTSPNFESIDSIEQDVVFVDANGGNYDAEKDSHSPTVKELVHKYDTDATIAQELTCKRGSDLETPKRVIPKKMTRFSLSPNLVSEKGRICKFSLENDGKGVNTEYSNSQFKQILEIPFLDNDHQRLQQINIKWAKG